MRSKDRLAITFDRMDESVLTRAHVAPHVVKRDHRAFDDRPNSDDRARARKHFQRGKRSVSRAKAENGLIGRNGLRAGVCGFIDCRSFGGPNLLKAIDDAGEIAIGDVSHCVKNSRGQTRLATSASSAVSNISASRLASVSASSFACVTPSTVPRQRLAMRAPSIRPAVKRVAVSMSVAMRPRRRVSSRTLSIILASPALRANDSV